MLSNLDSSAQSDYLATAKRLGIVPADAGSSTSEPQPDDLPPDPAAMRTERVLLDGLSCPSCAWVIEQVLLSKRGVHSARADFFTGTGQLTFDLRCTSLDELGQFIAPLGYRLDTAYDEQRRSSNRRSTLAFIVAAVITMNLMTLSSLRYFAGLGYLDQLPEFLHWLEALLLVPVLYIGWLPMANRALAALKRRSLTMDLLIGIAALAATVLSAAALLTGRDEIYFETAAGLVTIALLSRMIEARLRDRAFRDLVGLFKMKVTKVRLIDGAGEERYSNIGDIASGDRVVFLTGESIPFDGRLVGSTAQVSEAVLTGEPKPVTKHPGDSVSAGSTVHSGRLELTVIRRFEETRLHQITETLSTALSKMEHRLRLADRVSAWFVPLVLLIATGVWLWRLFSYGLPYALSPDGWFPSVAVLAVACPCAFSLAGVCAVTAATGSLLKKGLLVKELGQLELLHTIDHLIFDKTGTLTQGAMAVEQLVWRDTPTPELLCHVLAVEQDATHPVASAMRGYLQRHIPAESVPAGLPVEPLPGQGRRTSIDGRPFAVGQASLFDDPFIPEEMTPQHTAVWFGYGRRAAGCFLITDRVDPQAAGTIAGLKRLGITTELLSGDREQVTETVARTLGIDRATGAMSIDDKVARVKKRLNEGRTVGFVGDGTNDALAMNEAPVSIAVSRSTDEALLASGFVTLHGKLAHLTELFAMGRKLTRVIRLNYIWAFAFNTLFIPVAAAGKLAPLIAMILMLVSSSAVLLNSLRLSVLISPLTPPK